MNSLLYTFFGENVRLACRDTFLLCVKIVGIAHTSTVIKCFTFLIDVIVKELLLLSSAEPDVGGEFASGEFV